MDLIKELNYHKGLFTLLIFLVLGYFYLTAPTIREIFEFIISKRVPTDALLFSFIGAFLFYFGVTYLIGKFDHPNIAAFITGLGIIIVLLTLSFNIKMKNQRELSEVPLPSTPSSLS
ncbi:hypothetical protein J4421_02625 [Candidatus Woesearchaeota archaeon]|nr:hypothetical protein [Candidatus Woesearchaeota archaeon]